MATLMTGDTLTIRGYQEDTAQVQYNGTSGTLLKDVLIDLENPITEQQLFTFARGYYDTRMFPQAARLLVHFLHFYPESQYRPEALFYTGRTFEELACEGEAYDTLPGITKNENTSRYYYTGTAYKQLLEQFPSSIYAPEAAFYLVLCLRAADVPWKKSIDKISRDLERLQQLLSSYSEFENRAAAREEIGYDYRVLYELSGELSYRDQAESVFKKIVLEYPATVHEARARVHLSELENGIPIYLY